MGVKAREIRGMSHDDKLKILAETRGELMHQRGLAAMGGAVKNPGRIGDLRRTIARILTLVREEEFRTGRRLRTVARGERHRGESAPSPAARRRASARPAPPKPKPASAKVGATKAETAAAKERVKKDSKRTRASKEESA
ncbi:MAG TPA: 50S ribosomal protein L29 [Candidatus Thermoplasmatota archaeon]|nr:50S ribosomal protein L29 [Candidatus Thermoplasmatota archaeon]